MQILEKLEQIPYAIYLRATIIQLPLQCALSFTLGSLVVDNCVPTSRLTGASGHKRCTQNLS